MRLILCPKRLLAASIARLSLLCGRRALVESSVFSWELWTLLSLALTLRSWQVTWLRSVLVHAIQMLVVCISHVEKVLSSSPAAATARRRRDRAS